jgi:transposase
MALSSNNVLLLWEEGKKTREIAKIFNVCNGTICNIILRARDRGDMRAKRRRPEHGYYHREGKRIGFRQ